LQVIAKGRYRARLAETPDDLRAAQGLRHLCFHAGGQGLDIDRHDALCRHMLVEDVLGHLVCCYRLRVFGDGAGIADSYSAQFYDLSRLAAFSGPMVEMGRFCIAPERRDPDILRLAWAAMTRLVDAEGLRLMFGCSSFAGADPARHAPALRLLAERHSAPEIWAPRPRAPEVVALAELGAGDVAAAGVPPLLRTYLLMGG
jgi:L-ornithine Nalpha-acyltransferase